MAKKKDVETELLVITPPRMWIMHQRIVGTSPYVQARFSEKARQMMRTKQEAGSVAQKGSKREARDFDSDFEGAIHRGPKKQYGIPASAFRAACISACRLVGFKMTHGKLGLFFEADFTDPRDGTPLVAIDGSEPHQLTLPVRNTTGVADLRCRPQWLEWACNLRVRFDADMFRPEDAINLLTRVGLQVGIGEGRADSKKSAGMGWGHFRLEGKARVEKEEFEAEEPAVVTGKKK